MKIDKTKLRDSRGHPLTQGLFLEIGYDSETAVYTLKDDDHTHKGKVYPSLKRLFIACEDPTEYSFANDYLLGWSHWKRLQENKAIRKHIDEWREELELKIRSQAVRDIVNLSASENGGFQAAKWLADRGWDKRAAGRPSKKEKEMEDNFNARIEEEFRADFERLKLVK